MGARELDPGVWLLDFELGGHVYRFATEEVEVETEDGEALLYEEGLGEVSAPHSAVVGAEEVEVEIEISSDVDWALLVAQGATIDESGGVLRRWYDGQTLERARVSLRGLVRDASYGSEFEALTFSLVRSPRSQTRTLPPAQAVVSAATWPITTSPLHRVLDELDGAVYPVVIGCPGDTGEATPRAAVPVPMAEYRQGETTTSRVVWLGGHATQVRLFDRADEAEDDATVGAVEDLLGRTVQYALPDALLAEDGEWWLGFSADSSYGGGIKNHRGELLRGAGDVIEWVLREYYEGAVDWGRVAAARSFLNAYKIDAYFNTTCNVWDWLVSDVLPLLPVEMREGHLGIYPAVVRWDATERDVVAHLDATPGSGRLQRESAVTTLADIRNEVIVDFRPSSEDGSAWLARRAFSAKAGQLQAPDVTLTEDEAVYASYLCAESQRRYRRVYPLTIQAGVVWDANTAVLIARHHVAKHAWPRRLVTYSGGTWLETLEVGQAVTLTDPELHLESVLALVGDVVPGPGGASVELLILDHPLQRLRVTA